MIENDSIAQAMIRDHGKITGLIIRLENNKSTEWEDLEKDFESLKSGLKWHFLTEEMAIFMYLKRNDYGSYQMVEKLIKEHKTILKTLDAAETALNNGDRGYLTVLLGDISRHRIFEDREFYPKLDRELTPAQKKDIIKDISSSI
jgi:hemerythrin-like domain-containing protein